ncbi:MAG: LPXTG cell wall anchor domain-containing protein [Streptococcus orisratti]|uniref:LPXTG cell wall anchor domain-containing protein n=1 Tax=Streptococcus orisratti TaxID=114652 RepID=UPI002A9100C7|nr:LPXTG cell wall anchor domain-containing protein [Streptococcus orisratti]MDY5636455.1 LPXTG cell wall anchor domain-containing protein [Streptococcus orisratti]
MKTKVNNVYAFRKGKKTLASVAIASVFALGAGVVAATPVQTAHADDYIDKATKPTVTTDVPVTVSQKGNSLSVTAKPDSTIVPDAVEYTATMTNNDTGAIWDSPNILHPEVAEQYRAQPDATAEIYIGDAPDGNYTVTMTTKGDRHNVVDGTNYIYEGHTTIALDKGKVTTTPVTPSKPAEKPAETPVVETPKTPTVTETPSKPVEKPAETPVVETPKTPTAPEIPSKPAEQPSETPVQPVEKQEDSAKTPEENSTAASDSATQTSTVSKPEIQAAYNKAVTKAETAKVTDRRGTPTYQVKAETLPTTGTKETASFVLAGIMLTSLGLIGLKKREN